MTKWDERKDNRTDDELSTWHDPAIIAFIVTVGLFILLILGANGLLQ